MHITSDSKHAGIGSRDGAGSQEVTDDTHAQGNDDGQGCVHGATAGGLVLLGVQLLDLRATNR